MENFVINDFSVPVLIDNSISQGLLKEINKINSEVLKKALTYYLRRTPTYEDMIKCATEHIYNNITITERFLLYDNVRIGIIKEKYDHSIIDFNKASSSYKVEFIPAEAFALVKNDLSQFPIQD